MEILGYFLAGGLGAVLWFLFKRKKKSQFEVSPDTMPRTPRARPVNLARARRRRLAGGFYPIGYTGPYIVGEELVDELMWMEELAEMGELGRDDLGEFGDEQEHSVEDPRESGEFVTEPEPAEEAPEAEEFEPLDPEPAEEAPEAEEFEPLDTVPTPVKKAPAPAPEPEAEAIDESEVLNEELNRGWGVDSIVVEEDYPTYDDDASDGDSRDD